MPIIFRFTEFEPCQERNLSIYSPYNIFLKSRFFLFVFFFFFLPGALHRRSKFANFCCDLLNAKSFVATLKNVLKKDIRAVENVQRGLTRLFPELSDLSYEELFKKLNLTTLHYRRHRMDIIQVFKIIQLLMIFRWMDFLNSLTQTRGHNKKLKKKTRALKSLRINSFCVRVVNRWIDLTEDIVNSSTVLSFKTQYDRYMGDQKYQTGDIY